MLKAVRPPMLALSYNQRTQRTYGIGRGIAFVVSPFADMFEHQLLLLAAASELQSGLRSLADYTEG